MLVKARSNKPPELEKNHRHCQACAGDEGNLHVSEKGLVRGSSNEFDSLLFRESFKPWLTEDVKYLVSEVPTYDEPCEDDNKAYDDSFAKLQEMLTEGLLLLVCCCHRLIQWSVA